MTDSDKIAEQSYALARIARAVGINNMAAPMHIVAAVERYEQSVANRIADWLDGGVCDERAKSIADAIREGRWREGR